ncbi:MAG: lysine--tRNA ligase [Planctomycetota bacterium]|jgi:lysyl-tRNA synthetase class 2
MTIEFDKVRLEKMARMRDEGINPYPDRFSTTHSLKEAPDLPEGTKDVAVCGRIVALRDIGNLLFGKLQDVEGQFQFILEKKTIGPERLKWAKKNLDLGDHLGVKGYIFITKRGEISIMSEEFVLLSKGLLPLPEKWHGLQEVELCYRKRYLDLVANPATRERFMTCIKANKALRRFLEGRGFVETLTPAMASVASGALATPFVSHHNALGVEVFMRIAPETYLKRLLVGGFNKVYEFARCFRNEGVSPEHVQDFTMIEAYAAYWNYHDNMEFIREMLIESITEALGAPRFEFRGKTIDLETDWRTLTFREVVLEGCGLDIEEYPEAEGLLSAVKERKIDLEHDDPASLGRGNLIDLLYKRTARPKLTDPTYLIEHPIDLSPLARKNEERPGVSDRFQLLVGGLELVNGYTELADPVDQLKRFEEQAALRGKGDEEAMAPEFEFVEALGYSMPPASGWGMGLERFHMLITDSENIRDVVLFPLMRPEE